MIRTRIQVGPEDHGRRMSLEDFAERKLSSADVLRTTLLPGLEVRVGDLFRLPQAPAKKRRRNGRKDR